MAEQDTTVCPDCGATYQHTEEQQGKLLHCKCGRYLVAGGMNSKTVSVQAPAPQAAVPTSPNSAAPTIGIKTTTPDPTFGVKTVPPVITSAANVSTENHERETTVAAAPKDGQKLLIYGGTLAVIAIIGLAMLLFRSPRTTTPEPTTTVANVTSQSAQVPVVPCSGAPNRLENGTQITNSRMGHGMGVLEIENATSGDVAVRMTGSGSMTIAWVYIQQGQKAVVTGIPLGAHQVMVAAGSDWDPQQLTFKCNDVYSEFDKTLEYTDRREDDRTVYSTHRIVLGKQPTVAVSKADFFRGHFGS